MARKSQKIFPPSIPKDEDAHVTIRVLKRQQETVLEQLSASGVRISDLERDLAGASQAVVDAEGLLKDRDDRLAKADRNLDRMATMIDALRMAIRDMSGHGQP